MGCFFYIEQENKNKNDLIEFFSYGIADLKTLLLDIDNCCRGIGGSKKQFDYKKLPSMKTKKIEEEIKEETPEQALERQKRFFEQLKTLCKNK